MIEFENVTKIYGLTAALSNVSFRIDKGCTGLLGPNGSGKTTSLRLIAGFLKPDEGKVSVYGESPFNNPKITAKIGYVPEFDEPYPWMTAKNYLMWVAKIHGLSGGVAEEKVKRLIKTFGLEKFAHRKIGGYSRGMKQRVKLAQALLHDPEIILLDEPLSGLDPLWRVHVLNCMKKWKKEGKIVVYSTHLLFEAEKVVNNILFLYRGMLIGVGTIRELLNQLRGHPRTIKIELEKGLNVLLKELIVEEIVNDISIKERKDDSGIIKIKTLYPNELYLRLPEIIRESDAVVKSLVTIESDLNALYRIILKIAKGEERP
ncbi:MAG: ABC transporter ATP-binding protein [Candidatus Njordarchaeia archaeon]